MIEIDNTWTLFLDRDGVINERKMGEYITTKEDFKILPGVLEALSIFYELFKYNIVITNQAGVGKGLMSRVDLDDIHSNFLQDVIDNGGFIDGIYACTMLPGEIPNERKPQPDMAFMAKEDHMDIDLKKSVMVGDTISDLQFARNIGAAAILIDHGWDEQKLIPEELVDMRFDSLLSFAVHLKKSSN